MALLKALFACPHFLHSEARPSLQVNCCAFEIWMPIRQNPFRLLQLHSQIPEKKRLNSSDAFAQNALIFC